MWVYINSAGVSLECRITFTTANKIMAAAVRLLWPSMRQLMVFSVGSILVSAGHGLPPWEQNTTPLPTSPDMDTIPMLDVSSSPLHTSCYVTSSEGVKMFSCFSHMETILASPATAATRCSLERPHPPTVAPPPHQPLNQDRQACPDVIAPTTLTIPCSAVTPSVHVEDPLSTAPSPPLRHTCPPRIKTVATVTDTACGSSGSGSSGSGNDDDDDDDDDDDGQALWVGGVARRDARRPFHDRYYRPGWETDYSSSSYSSSVEASAESPHGAARGSITEPLTPASSVATGSTDEITLCWLPEGCSGLGASSTLSVG
ncbi:hypothetical protein BX600DRAFT_25420 [Xylariales sp. PMI_506]|nr:hypothetical protein BX600DRAFT_25420 [Xylariales sp. PMI_506]